MAMSGVLKKDFHKSGVFTLQIEWSVTSQSTENNTSVVEAKMYLISNMSGGTISSSTSKNGSIIIDGNTYNHSGLNVSISSGQKKLLATSTRTVTHNPDGTKSITIGGRLDINVTLSGTYYGTITIPTVTVSLAPIPRASSITSFPSFTIGNDFTVTIQRASSAFTHKLELKYGSTVIATRTGIGTSYTFSLSTAEQDALYAAMSNVTSGTVTLVCTTFNGSTQIGSPVSKTATATVGNFIVPSLTSITATEENSEVTLGFFIQNVSKIRFTVNGAQAGRGSTIKSIKVNFNSVNYNGSSVLVTGINVSGTLSATATVTDNRNRTASKTVNVTIVPYAAPKLTSVSIVRCYSDGSENPLGDHIKVVTDGNISSLDGNNTMTYKVSKKVRGSSTWTQILSESVSGTNLSKSNVFSGFPIESAFDIKIDITDRFNTTSHTTYVSTGKVTFSWGDEGIAVGKIYELDQETFQVGGDAKIEGNINQTGTVNALFKPIEIKEYGFDLNTVTTPGFYYCPQNIYAETYLNCPTNKAFALFVEKNAGTTQLLAEYMPSDFKMFIRNYYGGTWGAWQTFAFAENFLPLSGGQLSGPLSITNNAGALKLYGINNSSLWLGFYQDGVNRSAYIGHASTNDDNLTINAHTGDIRLVGTNVRANGSPVITQSNIRTGRFTATSTSGVNVSFSSAFPGVPIVITGYAKTGASVSGDWGSPKIYNITSSGFSCIIGGSNDSTARDINYLAIYLP